MTIAANDKIKAEEQTRSDTIKTTVIYHGENPITSAITSKKTPSEKNSVIKTATVAAMSKETYPLIVKNTSETTNVTIDTYRCDEEQCAYWVTAFRDGQQVYIDNPVWLINGNAPYHTIISDVYDNETNTETITLKEDPKGAVLNIMATFAEMQPVIGQKAEAVKGEKE